MKFHEEVVLFNFAEYPMVGNLQNGYIIGLNSNGASICKKLSSADMPLEDIEQADKLLCEHLGKGGFFQSSSPIKSEIRSAYLHVTQRCNLDCVGCYSLSEARNSLNDPSVDQIKQALELLKSAGVSNLVISGGEPFLRDDLAEIVDYAFSDLGMQNIRIITNGTIQKPDLLEKLAGKVAQIAVSIDGYSQECIPHVRKEQRFDDLIATIKTIQSFDINTHIIPTLHKKNSADAGQYTKLANDLGVTINFSLLSYPETDKSVADLLPKEEDLKELGRRSMELTTSNEAVFRDTPLAPSLCTRRNCGLANGTVSIDADGTVYPCHMLHDTKFAFGNAFQDDLESILSSSTRTSIVSCSVDQYPDCQECEIRYLCGGGCRARAYYSSGELSGRDSYCEMIKEFYSLYAQKLIAAKKAQEDASKKAPN